MYWHQSKLVVETTGRGTYCLNERVNRVVADSGLGLGLCHVFVQHTSASLMLCENADPSVRNDLESLMNRLAPDGDPSYTHTLEGPDDMAAHARTVLTANSLTVPITQRCCALGTWQGIYLWEHRSQAHRRVIVLTLNGLKQ